MKKCIILANGKPPKKSIINYLQKKNYSTLICADGGANKAKKLNLTPDYIIGDFDSIENKTLQYYSNKSKLIKFKRQTDTDVEKCLKHALKEKYNEIILLGVTGDRLDHTFCNLGIVIKFFKKIKLKLVAEESLLIPYSGKVELNTKPGEIISLYGFDKKTKISSRGLKYRLKNSTLPFGEKESTSNSALGEKVNLKISGGIIFVVRNFHIAKSNALT